MILDHVWQKAIKIPPITITTIRVKYQHIPATLLTDPLINLNLLSPNNLPPRLPLDPFLQPPTRFG
jgi:hypothetical protein